MARLAIRMKCDSIGLQFGLPSLILPPTLERSFIYQVLRPENRERKNMKKHKKQKQKQKQKKTHDKKLLFLQRRGSPKARFSDKEAAHGFQY